MIVGDKTREIGILRSMGVTSAGIARVFRSMGLFIGIVGTALGGVLGAALAWALRTFEFIDLPNDIYFLDTLPIRLDPIDVSLILGGSVLIAFLSTIYPARKAADLTPVEAIRHE
jgi:lipoprotein-releasing system permease protein